MTPLLPIRTTTRLGTICPGVMFRSDATGCAAGTLSTTAIGGLGVVEVIKGMPPQPDAVPAIVPPGPTGDVNPPVPVRVSRIRAGVTPVNVDPVVVVTPSLYQPATSAMMFTDPRALRKLILPPAPSLTSTRLGIACPGTRLRLEASGLRVAAGKTVTKLDAVASAAVTLSTTAETPVSGTPPRPLTCSVIAWPAPTGAVYPPLPFRVSRIRAGTSGL